jgi:hypothetical protein
MSDTVFIIVMLSLLIPLTIVEEFDPARKSVILIGSTLSVMIIFTMIIYGFASAIIGWLL